MKVNIVSSLFPGRILLQTQFYQQLRNQLAFSFPRLKNGSEMVRRALPLQFSRRQKGPSALHSAS